MVTDKQVRRLFALIKTEESQEIAASKAGMDAKTARKYRRLERLPSELPSAVRGRTRPDPFIDVWDNVQKLFEDNAGPIVGHGVVSPLTGRAISTAQLCAMGRITKVTFTS